MKVVAEVPHAYSHACYFCKPDAFPVMPNHRTLCARCGVLIAIPGVDPMNNALAVCDRCETEIEEEL